MHVAQLFSGMTSLKPVVGAYWAERTQGWGIWHTPAPCKVRKERGTRGRKISVRGLLAVIHDIRKSPPYLQIAGTGWGAFVWLFYALFLAIWAKNCSERLSSSCGERSSLWVARPQVWPNGSAIMP